MIGDLTAEVDEEIMVECTVSLHAYVVDTTAMNADVDLQATIDNLSNTLFTLKDEVGGLPAVGSIAIIEMKRASVDREVENKDFQVNVADQSATQAILTSALDRLKMLLVAKAVFVLKSKSDKKSLLSGQQDTGSFLTYKKNDKSDGVMGRIQRVNEDVKALASEATAVQQEVENAYETFISDSNKSTAGKCKSIAEIMEMGTQDNALVTAMGAMKGVMADLEPLFYNMRRTSALTERRARPFPRT